MRQRQAFGLPSAYSGHSIRFMACHEGAFRLPKAGEKRIEWYRYGDSNPGYKVENLVS